MLFCKGISLLLFIIIGVLLLLLLLIFLWLLWQDREENEKDEYDWLCITIWMEPGCSMGRINKRLKWRPLLIVTGGGVLVVVVDVDVDVDIGRILGGRFGEVLVGDWIGIDVVVVATAVTVADPAVVPAVDVAVAVYVAVAIVVVGIMFSTDNVSWTCLDDATVDWSCALAIDVTFLLVVDVNVDVGVGTFNSSWTWISRHV